ncbi:YueI family protein [Bacillus sp. 31A1R]|uniref:YueI family protein n=1 Tax=Robertmurraya mangrovi TaxID=3098077 RepID=A0ABU5J2M2_9BACI|nr:YueI family protein [Bacillus sp. 31A1R]MDZ5473605.1 YueI family protein [Bacillus sp. 31A1R]
MSYPDIDDYLQQGIHGQKETKPDERRKFLGTIRERVVIALTQPQVRKEGVFKEVEEALKANPKAHLYLNGNISYEYLSKYTKLCNQYGVEYTLVTNKDYNSELGLVLAHDYAIDKEDIYISTNKPPKIETKQTEKKGFFAKLFNK